MPASDDVTDVSTKLAFSAVVVAFAIPGLLFEPGPLSEIVALVILAAIWLPDEEAAAVGSAAPA